MAAARNAPRSLLVELDRDFSGVLHDLGPGVFVLRGLAVARLRRGTLRAHRGGGASQILVGDLAGAALGTIILDSSPQREPRALRIVFLLVRIAVQRIHDVLIGDGKRFVERLSARQLDQQAARGGAESATRREVRDVLDHVAGPDLQIIRIHVAARVAEILTRGHRVFHGAESGAVFDQLLKLREVHALISNRHSTPPVASDSVWRLPRGKSSPRTLWIKEQTCGCSLTVSA